VLERWGWARPPFDCWWLGVGRAHFLGMERDDGAARSDRARAAVDRARVLLADSERRLVQAGHRLDQAEQRPSSTRESQTSRAGCGLRYSAGHRPQHWSSVPAAGPQHGPQAARAETFRVLRPPGVAVSIDRRAGSGVRRRMPGARGRVGWFRSGVSFPLHVEDSGSGPDCESGWPLSVSPVEIVSAATRRSAARCQRAG
jgi:hypothetical protein